MSYGRLLTLVFLLHLGCFLFAQDKTKDHQQLLWYRYDLQHNITKEWKGQFEIENRQYWFPWRQHQLLIRASADRLLPSNSAVGGGFCYFLQSSPQDPQVIQYADYIELRPHIWLKHRDELTEKFNLEHRLMNELRFFEDRKGNFPYSNMRLRYQITAVYSLNEHLKFNAFNEIHMNMAKSIVLNTFDQNRLGVGIDFKLNKQLSVELNYFKWYQQLNTGVDFVLRDITRLTLHHTW